ncbi:hypothetical protein D0322_08905 [Campylobacter coli]|nr:hypothetical protein [Campylobacter coli]EAM0015230.1 hypothetical protein [Campylobacter coli]KQI15687.1 hypothetical protein K777_03160 [Campylobacter coli CVM 41970]
MRPRSKKDQKKKALPLNKSLNLAFSQKLNLGFHITIKGLCVFSHRKKQRSPTMQCKARNR